MSKRRAPLASPPAALVAATASAISVCWRNAAGRINVRAMIDAHRVDPKLHRVLVEQIPHPTGVVAAPGGDDEVLPEPWPLWRYHALAILVVVGSGWLLVVLSNRAEGGMW